MIDKLKLKNFTVFGECEIDFSPGVNVILGENGTGKTHLLKAIYSSLAWTQKLENKNKVTNTDIGNSFFEIVKSQFSIRNENLSPLVRNGSKGGAAITAILPDSDEVSFSIGRRLNTTKASRSNSLSVQHNVPIVLPAKEVFSFLEAVFSLSLIHI